MTDKYLIYINEKLKLNQDTLAYQTHIIKTGPMNSLNTPDQGIMQLLHLDHIKGGTLPLDPLHHPFFLQ
jgi:hypothetical protein